MRIQIIIILLVFSIYKCKFPDNKTRDEIEEIYKAKYLKFETHKNLNNLYEQNARKYAFPNTIRIKIFNIFKL